jgi:hypothetical protein
MLLHQLYWKQIVYLHHVYPSIYTTIIIYLHQKNFNIIKLTFINILKSFSDQYTYTIVFDVVTLIY